jgi:putative acetyltransferase
VIVRQADAQDAEAMARVIAAVAPEGFLGAEPPVDVDERARRLADMISGPDRGAGWVLADDGGGVVGFATVQERFAGVLSLGMAILADARGRGGGRALLDAILEHARATGAHKVELEAWVDNSRAIALYAAAGFEVEGVRRDHYRRQDGRLRSTLLMARLLDRDLTDS